MSTLELIVEDLKQLPAPKLEEAAAFIHGLMATNRVDREAIMRETSGIFSPEDGDLIQRAIEEGCERIDDRGW